MREDDHHNTTVSFSLQPLLRSMAGEVGAVAVRVCAYLGSLGALALLAVYLLSSQITLGAGKPEASPTVASAGLWTRAFRPQPAFSAPVAELIGKPETYDIHRHPQGGRKDILRWTDVNGTQPFFGIDLYRPGAELTHFRPAAQQIAASTDAEPGSVEAAGVIETKFGAVPLARFVRNTGAAIQSCIGFSRDFDTPRLQISGWSCQGATAQLQRQSIACALDRLTMLSAGNDTTLAALFAHAELRRAGCTTNTASPDWVTATREPVLRGSLASMAK